MGKLQVLMDDVSEWSDSKFGKENRTLPIIHHLKKEVKELIEAIEEAESLEVDCIIDVEYYYEQVEKAKIEFVDCFMLLIDGIKHFGISEEELFKLSRIKFDINRNRKWGKPDKNGVVEHIK